MEWLAEDLILDGREFHKLEALLRKSYRPRIFLKVEPKRFDCGVKHKERNVWTIWKYWQERGRISYQK